MNQAPVRTSPREPARQRPRLSLDELRDVLTITLRAGQLMLENGANTARVEETMHRLGTALGAEWMDIYVTPTGIIATDVSYGEHRTKIQRVVKSGVDLSRVAAVIELMRRAEGGELDREAVRHELERIAVQPRLYGRWMTIAAVALACSCFAALFGGGPRELVATFVAAAVGQWLRERLVHINLMRLITAWVVAVAGSGLALTLATLIEAPAPQLALLSSVLLLVPGVLTVSSVADLIRGDTVSGMARATMALLTFAAIGAGVWTTLVVSGVQLALAPQPAPGLLFAFLLAYGAAGGFAVLFDVPYRALPLSALVGALAVLTRQASLEAGLPIDVAVFLAGLTIGTSAELLGRLLRQPTSLFAIPAFIPLVPGVPAYRTVVGFVEADYLAGLADFVQATLVVGAIAAGMATATAIATLRRRPLF